MLRTAAALLLAALLSACSGGYPYSSLPSSFPAGPSMRVVVQAGAGGEGFKTVSSSTGTYTLPAIPLRVSFLRPDGTVEGSLSLLLADGGMPWNAGYDDDLWNTIRIRRESNAGNHAVNLTGHARKSKDGGWSVGGNLGFDLLDAEHLPDGCGTAPRFFVGMEDFHLTLSKADLDASKPAVLALEIPSHVRLQSYVPDCGRPSAK